MRQTSRPILPLLPPLRSHHLSSPSASARLLPKPQPTHAATQQPHDRRSLRRLRSPLRLGHQRRPHHHGARGPVYRHRRRGVSRPLGHHPRSPLRPPSQGHLTSCQMAGTELFVGCFGLLGVCYRHLGFYVVILNGVKAPLYFVVACFLSLISRELSPHQVN